MQTDQPARHTGGLIITPFIIDSHIKQSPYHPARRDPDARVVFTLKNYPASTAQGTPTRRDATALVPVPDTLSEAPDILKQVQGIVDEFPTRAFHGHIEAAPEHGTPWRYVVNRHTRLVEVVHPRVVVVWPGDAPVPMGGTKGPSKLVRKLMRFFQERPGVWMYGAEVGRELGVQRESVTNALVRLKDHGLLEDEWGVMRVGRGTTRVHKFAITAKGLAWRP